MTSTITSAIPESSQSVNYTTITAPILGGQASWLTAPAFNITPVEEPMPGISTYDTMVYFINPSAGTNQSEYAQSLSCYLGVPSNNSYREAIIFSVPIVNILNEQYDANIPVENFPLALSSSYPNLSALGANLNIPTVSGSVNLLLTMSSPLGANISVSSILQSLFSVISSLAQAHVSQIIGSLPAILQVLQSTGDLSLSAITSGLLSQFLTSQSLIDFTNFVGNWLSVSPSVLQDIDILLNWVQSAVRCYLSFPVGCIDLAVNLWQLISPHFQQIISAISNFVHEAIHTIVDGVRYLWDGLVS